MTDHEEISEQADAEAERMQRHIDDLGDRVKSTRQTWEAAKADPSVPGAPGDEHGQPSEPVEGEGRE